MPRKTKIGREVAHVTRDLDTTLKVKGPVFIPHSDVEKVNLQGTGHIVAASSTACYYSDCFYYEFLIMIKQNEYGLLTSNSGEIY